MNTLLEVAKGVNPNPHTVQVTPEMVELSLAWIKGQITTTQASMAMTGLKRNSGNALYRFSVALRQAYQDGRLIIK